MTRPGEIRSGVAKAPTLQWREHALLLAALGLVIGAAWLYLVHDARSMGAIMTMATTMETRPRGIVDFGYLFLMWAVMMVAMMVPSATPVVLVYSAVSRRSATVARGALWVAAFISGYVIVWSGFSMTAAALQVWLERIALLSPHMVVASPVLAALLLASAGSYQLSPLKDVCLHQCRSPVEFIAQYWRPGAWGALRMGMSHGTYCVGCCWVLMGLLFVGGVMNLLWLVTISVFVILEKSAFVGSAIGRRTTGWCLIVAALVLLAAKL